MDTQPSLDASLWLDPNDVAAGQGEAWRSWLRTSFPEFSLLPSANPSAGGARLLTLGSARSGWWSFRRA